MVRMSEWGLAALVCVIAVDCESSEPEPDRTCLTETCDGFDVDLGQLGMLDPEAIANLIETGSEGVECSFVRLRGAIRCTPAGRACGWENLEEAESARANIERALEALSIDGGADAQAMPAIDVEACSCRTYISVPCPAQRN